MSALLEVRLPLHTVSEANRREHWSKRAKRVREQRGVVCMAFQSAAIDRALPPLQRIAPIEVTLTRVAPRELDDDNLRGALKACRDGVADALKIDDRDPSVRWAYAQERGAVREYAVAIRVERV